MNAGKLLALLGFFLIVGSLFASAAKFESSKDNISKIDQSLLDRFDKEKEVEVTIVLATDLSKRDASVVYRVLGLIDKEDVIDYYYSTISAKLTLDEVQKLAKSDDVTNILERILFRQSTINPREIVGANAVGNIEVNGLALDGTGQTICIIDSGIDFTHPALADKVIGGGNVDCSDPGIACSEISQFNEPTDGHGTAVAGIAAASGGIDGIAKGANLIGVNVFDVGSDVTGFEDIARGYNWCFMKQFGEPETNISVISMSLGSIDLVFDNTCDLYGGPDGLFEDFNDIIEIAGNIGISTVASSGNDGSSTGITAPACLSDVIPVGGTEEDDTLGIGSNYNQLVRLFAPIHSNTTIIGGGYAVVGGTSASAPMVSGAIAILNQYLDATGQPAMHPKDEIEPLLFSTSDPVIGLDHNLWGRLNIFKAILSLDDTDPEVELASDSVRALTSVKLNLASNIPSLSCNVTDEFTGIDTVELSIWDALNGSLVYSETKEFDGESDVSASFLVPRDLPFNIEASNLDTSSNNNRWTAIDRSRLINNKAMTLQHGQYEWNCEAADLAGNTGSATDNSELIVY